VATIAVAAVPTAHALAHGIGRSGDPAADPQAINAWALLTLFGVAALAAVAWRLQRILRRRVPLLAWCAAAVIVLAIPFAAQLLPIVLCSVLVAAASCTALLLNARGTVRLGRLQPVLLALMIAATTLGYFVSWGSSGTWWIGSAFAIAITFLSRYLLRGAGRAAGRAALLPATALLIVIAGGFAPWALTLGRSPDRATTVVNVLGGIALSAAVLQLAIALPWQRGLHPQERRSTFWFLLLPSVAFLVLLLPAVGSTASVHNAGLVVPEPLGSLARAVVLLVALILWLTIRRDRAGLRRERLVAVAGLGPVLAMTGSAAARVAEANAIAQVVVIAAAGLLTCAVGLVVGVTRTWARAQSRRRDRLALEVGAAVAFGWAIGVAATSAPDAMWLILLLAGLTFLVAAIDTDGLFASHSLRRHGGWIALALGVASLWLQLGESSVEALEPYVLPVAAALLVLALLLWRLGPSTRNSHASAGAATLLLAGLAVAIVPLAIVSMGEDIVRPAIVGGASAALLLAACTLRWSAYSAAYCAAAGLPSALGVVLVVSGRIVHAIDAPTNAPWIVEAWLLTACVVLTAAGFLLVRHSDAEAATLRARSGTALLVVALLLAAIGEHVAAGQGHAAVHIILLVWVLSAVHAVAFWARVPPLTALVGWLAITLAALAIVVDASRLAPTPIEIVTMPFAIALLLSGAVKLTRTPTARSWPWLGPGVAVLLVPSLVIGFSDATLWRIVALGIAAIGVLVVGLVLRLQALFVLGSVVVLVHALVQLWPWISAAYAATSWWMWLGAGGIILIVLAARYEQRIRNIRSVVLKISALR
ncbi:MAG: hypothetical protein ABI310_10020, partial [Microbacteriaceae bacterium]